MSPECGMLSVYTNNIPSGPFCAVSCEREGSPCTEPPNFGRMLTARYPRR